MATLQNIRSKGPLLVIVIGLALFAFIAGDAWKVLQPHQSQDVGEVNGETISAQDFQALVEEYTEVVKFSSGLNSLSDEKTNLIKDVYGNRIYREKDLRDDGGVLQRPLGEGCRPEAQERRRAVGKMAHGRGGLRAVENQPAHVADFA